MVGDSERKGFELVANWKFRQNMDFGFSYSYIDSQEFDAEGIGIRELRRPKNMGSFNINHESLNKKWSSSFSSSYGGTRNDIFYPPWPESSQIVILKNYWLIDFAVHYELSQKNTLFIRGTNILDTDYEELYGYQTPGSMLFLGFRSRLL